MTAFHSWLIRQRRFCDKCSDLTEATTVENLNGRDLVLCDTHANRLKAVRLSDTLQDFGLKEPKPQTHRPRLR